MSTTSTAVKRKYNDKIYIRFAADLRNEFYEEIETARGEMSRAQFLQMLYNEHKERVEKEQIEKEQ